ncbi:MAG TPA: hypothetical protein QGF05_00975 [Dehalococcoidia bacterium]|nr:hypothetical protein [Dehalococcoidia bacterium]
MGRVELRGHEHPFDGGVDLAVHPDAQGRGLGSMLRDREAERTFGTQGIRFDTAPANPLSRQMYAARGPVTRPLDHWVRPLTARAALGLLARARPAQLLDRARHARRPRRAAPPTHDGRVEPVDSFDARAAALWDRVRPAYQLARIRDADWLNWRYCDARAGLIRAYQVAEADRLLGYAVFRRDGRRGRLLDVVTDPAVPGTTTSLLARGLADLADDDCTHVESLLPRGHREAAALREAGFFPSDAMRDLQLSRARHVAVPAVLEVIADPTAPIHVMPGDFDHQ